MDSSKKVSNCCYASFKINRSKEKYYICDDCERVCDVLVITQKEEKRFIKEHITIAVIMTGAALAIFLTMMYFLNWR